jgi:polyribonucleotide nucleotidyltransferase
MFKTIRYSFDFHGKEITLETGKIARQADGAVVIKCGKTFILSTVVFSKEVNEQDNFFPLTVNYNEKYSAIGKIPGGFVKRETKPSEAEILTSRLIDRSIRPIFAENFYNETQVNCTVFSHEKGANNDFLSLIATVAALRAAKIPLVGTVAGVKLNYLSGKFVINPSHLDSGKLDMFVSGCNDSILMVESRVCELSEDVCLEAISVAMNEIKSLSNHIDTFIDLLNQSDGGELFKPVQKDYSVIQNFLTLNFKSQIEQAFDVADKQARDSLLAKIDSKAIAKCAESFPDVNITRVSLILKGIKKSVMRTNIAQKNRRIDGRKNDEIRPITVEKGLLPNVHGSALFTRGNTQVLVSVTIGASSDEQIVDALDGSARESFMLHYNFPAYSVGELGRSSAPGRREIGHGALAKKSIAWLIPSRESFPQTIRVVSDVTESNGSTSMATVCGAILALEDAGVPLKTAVSGIAMGLIKENDDCIVLSDILGDEDFLGDMDFKVAGTENGITALQMDVKITGVNITILTKALTQAREGRLHIMSKMNVVNVKSSQPKFEVLKVVNFTVPEDKVKLVIGPGGSVIKDICAKTNATIDIDRSGNVKIAAQSDEAISLANEMIKSILSVQKEALVENKVYKAKVMKIIEHGAIIELRDGNGGLVHLSELSLRKPNRVSDVVLEGETLMVLFLGQDQSGRAKFSLKSVDQESLAVNRDL